MPLQVLGHSNPLYSTTPDSAAGCLNAGIGRRTAIALSIAGWNVVLTARRQDALKVTADLTSKPDSCLILAGDVTNEEFVRDLFTRSTDKFGSQLSILTEMTMILTIPICLVGRLDLLFNARISPIISVLINNF